MNQFSLTDEQKAFADKILKLVRDEMETEADIIDREARYPEEEEDTTRSGAYRYPYSCYTSKEGIHYCLCWLPGMGPSFLSPQS